MQTQARPHTRKDACAAQKKILFLVGKLCETTDPEGRMRGRLTEIHGRLEIQETGGEADTIPLAAPLHDLSHELHWIKTHTPEIWEDLEDFQNGEEEAAAYQEMYDRER